MEFRPTPVNGMVLVAMGAYVAAALALGAGALVGMGRASRRRGRAPGKAARGLRVVGWALYAAGFAVSLAAWLVRWHEVQHAPLQNLYEVFLTMGALMLPISLFCRRALRVGTEWADAVLAAVVLFPVAMVFNPEPQYLPAALQSPLFVPHVATYLAAYVVLGKAAVQAFGCLVRGSVATLAGRACRGSTAGDSTGRAEQSVELLGAGASVDLERATYTMVCFGFPLLMLGLVLGAWWGKLAWGDYWNWDPKELWSLVSWLVFLAYLHFRAVRGPRSPVLGSALVLAGTACILITLLWANLSRLFAGLHSYA